MLYELRISYPLHRCDPFVKFEIVSSLHDSRKHTAAAMDVHLKETMENRFSVEAFGARKAEVASIFPHKDTDTAC